MELGIPAGAAEWCQKDPQEGEAPPRRAHHSRWFPHPQVVCGLGLGAVPREQDQESQERNQKSVEAAQALAAKAVAASRRFQEGAGRAGVFTPQGLL